MTEPKKERGWEWALVIVVIIAFVIFFPMFVHIPQVDLDNYVERGSFWYMLVHDSRWIIGAMIGYLAAELHLACPKGMLKEGKMELMEWINQLRSRK